MNISVIIPVHNSVPFLDRCLSSVLPQLNEDDEILLLENGSTDNSWEVCGQYAARDKRIRAFRLGACGVSRARNEGIRLAECDWITFLDSDDFLAADSFSEAHLWSESVPADFLSYDFIPTDSSGNIPENVHEISGQSEKPCKADPDLLVRSALQFAFYRDKAEACGFNHATIWTCWAKFFRADFLRSNGIYFPDGLVLSEDTYFMVSAFLHADNIFSYFRKIYMYRANDESVSRKPHPKQLENNHELRKKMYELIKRNDTERRYRRELAAFLTRKFIEEIIYISDSSDKTPERGVQYSRKVLRENYMKKAVHRTGYRNLIIGKKNSLRYGLILWCLKHRTESLYFEGHRLLADIRLPKSE